MNPKTTPQKLKAFMNKNHSNHRIMFMNNNNNKSKRKENLFIIMIIQFLNLKQTINMMMSTCYESGNSIE